MSLTYTIVGDEDGSNIVVFVSGSAPLVAHSSHPHYDAIVQGARDGDESVTALFDLAQSASDRFESLSERVSVRHGRIFLDGEEIANALTEQVRRFLEEGTEDWRPLVAFFENVQANPDPHSREQLYAWLAAERFTITPDGLIVGYKGVASDGSGGYLSIHSGRAIVNGEPKSGRIPNNPGDIVTMPRGEVTHDPASACNVGLHVGTWGYAHSFGNGATLEVHVHPRDVVSVPTDCGAQKMRTCRYRVIRAIEEQYSTAVRWDEDGDEY